MGRDYLLLLPMAVGELIVLKELLDVVAPTWEEQYTVFYFTVIFGAATYIIVKVATSV